MFSKLVNFINHLGYDLFYENGSLSLSKLAACWGYLVFTISSIYLMLTGQTWSHYTEFATYMAGTSTFILTGHKFINSKYNSVIGGYGTSDGTRENIRAPQAQILQPVQEKINTVNQTINKASEVYDECIDTANKVVNTINNAKQTAEKIETGIKTVFNSSSIKEGINLAKNNKNK